MAVNKGTNPPTVTFETDPPPPPAGAPQIGTPEVLIAFTKFVPPQVKDSTPPRVPDVGNGNMAPVINPKVGLAGDPVKFPRTVLAAAGLCVKVKFGVLPGLEIATVNKGAKLPEVIFVRVPEPDGAPHAGIPNAEIAFKNWDAGQVNDSTPPREETVGSGSMVPVMET